MQPLNKGVLNKETLLKEIEKYLEDKEADALCDEIDKLGIPVASINQLDEIHEDPQVLEQKSLIEAEHPVGGKMRMPKPPFNFINQNDFPKSHAPVLGQHNREVLLELGVDMKKRLLEWKKEKKLTKKLSKVCYWQMLPMLPEIKKQEFYCLQ